MKKKLAHYGLVFLGAFGITALTNADHLLNAHGLDAAKSAGIALLLTAASAGAHALVAALRKEVNPGD